MPEYMVTVLANEADERALAPAQTKALVEGRAAYEARLRAAAALVDCGRLRPSSEARRVRSRAGQVEVTAGPFEGESVRAFVVLAANDLAAATALAHDCPIPPGATLEVRPIAKAVHHPHKADHQGRVFACLVLGNAANEPAWIEIMDRVEASARHPTERWSGGLRLEAPSRGRRSTAGARTFFDGPFLESKEVIGGLFFLRMSTLEEAVDWASHTELVEHCTLEIRELWRS